MTTPPVRVRLPVVRRESPAVVAEHEPAPVRLGLGQRVVRWFADEPHALWGTAVARVVYGVYTVLLVVVNFSDRELLWGAGSSWTQPWRDESRWAAVPFGFFQPGDHGAVLTVKLIVLGVLGAAMALGLCSRASTIAVLCLSTGLVALGPTSSDTEDIVFRILLVYLCLADTSQHLSLDRWIAVRKGRDTSEIRGALIPRPLRVPLHNAAVALVCGQLSIIYVMAGLAKLRGEHWRDGSAIYYTLHLEQYSPWPGLGHLVSGLVPVVILASWGAVLIQIGFPVLMLNARTRFFAVLAMIALHIGIAVMLGLSLFSLAMVGADFVFVRDASVQRLLSRLRR